MTRIELASKTGPLKKKMTCGLCALSIPFCDVLPDFFNIPPVSYITATVNKTSLLLVVYRQMIKGSERKKDDVNMHRYGSTCVKAVQKSYAGSVL